MIAIQTNSCASFVHGRRFQLEQQPILKVISRFLILGLMLYHKSVSRLQDRTSHFLSPSSFISVLRIYVVSEELLVVFFVFFPSELIPQEYCISERRYGSCIEDTSLARVLHLLFGQEGKMGQIQTCMAHRMHAAFLLFPFHCSFSSTPHTLSVFSLFS